MIKNRNLLVIALLLITFRAMSAQNEMNPPTPKPTPKPTASTSNLKYSKQTNEISREKREEAYTKLLEGQRYIWGLSNARNQSGITAGTNSAKEAIQKAIELDPNLAEGYTALAELTYKSPPNDVDEAIRLAMIAVNISPDNFGAHQIVARLYTIKSRINGGIIDEVNARKAIEEWNQVVRLDPRNAEAFAFLSEFYDKTNQPKERIDALKKWLSAAAPVDSRFYRGITGESDLSPENALVKLGAALLKEGDTLESVKILSRAVADNPNNNDAVELLSRAIESADDKTAATAVESLQQATFANPDNVVLINLLAQIQSREGKTDDAVKLLRDSISKNARTDKEVVANLQLSLGEVYFNAKRYDEAIAVYKSVLLTLGIENNELKTDSDRNYATVVYEKMIKAFKDANRPADVKKTIDEARLIFGRDDSFVDIQLIEFYRENGQRDEALKTVRAARARAPRDYNLLRFEAQILTDSGRVEEGVALLKALIINKERASSNISNSPASDDFTNYYYISNFYNQAKRGKEAVAAANQALAVASTDDRKLIAKLTLANGQQTAGDYQAAEQNLREVIQQQPENSTALNNLGYFLLERNEKFEEALKLIQRAVKLEPNNPSFLDSLGWAYFKLGKLVEAEKYIKDALKFDSSSTTVLEHLGDVYQSQGKNDLAETNWNKALKTSTDAAEINRLKTKLETKVLK